MILKIAELASINGHIRCTLQTGSGEFAGYYIVLHPTVVDEMKKVQPRSLKFESEKEST